MDSFFSTGLLCFCYHLETSEYQSFSASFPTKNILKPKREPFCEMISFQKKVGQCREIRRETLVLKKAFYNLKYQKTIGEPLGKVFFREKSLTVPKITLKSFLFKYFGREDRTIRYSVGYSQNFCIWHQNGHFDQIKENQAGNCPSRRPA